MKTESTSDNENKGHSQAKHMWMMAVCCGLPIIGFLVISAIGISTPSFETLFLIICPIGMIGMMYMMHRDSQQKGNAGCDSEKSSEEAIPDTPRELANGSERDHPKPKQPVSFEA